MFNAECFTTRPRYMRRLHANTVNQADDEKEINMQQVRDEVKSSVGLHIGGRVGVFFFIFFLDF